MVRLMIAILVAAVAYSGAWIWTSRAREAQFEAKLEEVRAAGWEISHGGLRSRGFPSRVDMNVTQLRAVAPSGAVLEAPVLQVMSLVYQPGTAILAWPEGQRIVIGGQVIKIEGERLRASIHPGETGWPDPMTLESGPGQLDAGGGVKVQWSEVLAATRQIDGGEEVYLRLGGAELVTPLASVGPLPQTIVTGQIAPDGTGEAQIETSRDVLLALSLIFGPDFSDGQISFDLGASLAR